MWNVLWGAAAGQLGGPTSPTKLPGPPVLEHLLLESPFLLTAALVVLGVAAAVALVRRARIRDAVVVLASCIAAGAGVQILAWKTVTNREVISGRSVELVEAVATLDYAGIERLLAPDARLFADIPIPELPIPAAGLDVDDILSRVRTTVGGMYRVREHRVVEIDAAMIGDRLGRTQLRVRVVPEATGFPQGSWWRLDWREEPDGSWRVIRIAPLSIGQGG